SVREAASLPPRDQLGIGLDDPRKLVDEPALPDAGDADERQQLRRPTVARPVERVADGAEFTVAPDELRASLVRDVDAEARMGRGRPPDGDRLALPLRLDRVVRLVVNRVAR